MTCIAWMYHTLLEYLLVSIFLTCQVFFFSSSLILFLRLHFCLSSNNPLSPVCFTAYRSLFVDPLSVHATAWHTLFLNKQNTSFTLTNKSQALYFLWAAKPARGPLLLNCQHSAFHSPHRAYTSPSSLPLSLSLSHTQSRHCTGIHKLSQGT